MSTTLRTCWKGLSLMSKTALKPLTVNISSMMSTRVSAFSKPFQTSYLPNMILNPAPKFNFQAILPIRQFSCLPNTGIKRNLLEPNHTINKSCIRTKINCSRKKGRGKSNYAVLSRFFRLRSGLWIRPRSGRENRKWAKTKKRVHRLQQMVFCNKTQSRLLDRLVTSYWHRKRYFPDDPYEIYQERTNLKYAPTRQKFYP